MSTTAAEAAAPTSPVTTIRALAGGVAATIIIDALSVGAPGLALGAVPFLIAAIGLRTGRTVSCIALALWAALWVLISVNYAVANGFDAGWGDLLGVYVGGTLAGVVVVLSIATIVRRSRAGLTRRSPA